MQYLFIDRIHRIEAGRSITATKNVALSEDYFRDHFVGYPVMPGALLIESLAQAGTALLEITNGFRKKALLVMVDGAKFRALVRPGDRLTITGELTSLDDTSARMEGRIDVDGKRVADAVLTFAQKEIDRFYPPHLRHVMEALYRTWLENSECIGVTLPAGIYHA